MTTRNIVLVAGLTLVLSLAVPAQEIEVENGAGGSDQAAAHGAHQHGKQSRSAIITSGETRQRTLSG